MIDEVILREYKHEDHLIVSKLAYEAVHSIPTDIYTQKQLDAWASESLLVNGLDINRGLVCIYKESIIGFIELILVNEIGFINYLYVHPDYQRKGVANLLYKQVETESIEEYNSSEFVVKASFVARPFFEQHGFSVVEKNRIKRGQVILENYTMLKNIES